MANVQPEVNVTAENGNDQTGPAPMQAQGGNPNPNQGRRGQKFGRPRDFGDREDRRNRGPPRFLGPRNMDGGGPQQRNVDDRINDRLAMLNGPTFELPSIDLTEKKFSGRSRLYIGNLPADITEEEVNELFKPYGETNELFVNKEKNFGFIRLDYHSNAEKAKRELDGTIRKGRMIKVRFAPNGSAIKVTNLTQWVTNELLYTAFSVFGDIERCVIIVDDRGKSMGEGVIEFARKPSATAALKRCNEGCFFLTSSLRPVIVENYDQLDITDGYSEKLIMKKSADFHQAREIGPRFAAFGSFEYEYGMRWKQLHELYRQKKIALKQELAMEEDKLEAQMQFAKFENETEMLREQLRVREMDRDRQKREWEERERLADEQRVRNEEQMRRQQDEMQMRMHHQEEEVRRRQQENTLFMQAHQLSDMLDQQEQVIKSYSPSDNQRDYNKPGSAGQPPSMESKPFMGGFEKGNRFDGPGLGRGMGDMGKNPGSALPPRGAGRGHWVNDGRRDDYQNKRRRY